MEDANHSELLLYRKTRESELHLYMHACIFVIMVIDI